MNYHDPDDRELKRFFNSKAQVVVVPDSVQLAIENSLSSLSEQHVKRGYPMKRWRWAAAAIALLFVLSTVSFYTVPTFAEMIRSLFVKNHPDRGLLKAQELGLVNNPHIKEKDKGYTLVINEAVADPTRVTMALQLFDRKGKHARDKLVLGDVNHITIKDDQGNTVDTMYDMGFTNDFYYLVAFIDEPMQTDKITIEGIIESLGRTNEKSVEGNWNFSFDIDMKDANRQTRYEELSGSYTTPHGMTVTLKRLTRMVQGVRFELETELDKAALTRSPGDLWKNQTLSFHFETEEGEEIHSVNARKSEKKYSLMTSDHHVVGNGKVRWSYTFNFLPEHEPYRFVLDGYTVPELDGSEISFKPSSLKVPKSFEILDDKLELVGASLEDSQRGDGKYETAVSFYGEMENEVTYDQWRAYEPSGKSYDIQYRGASRYYKDTLPDSWREGLIEMGDRSMQQPYEFRIVGLKQIPYELTLVREVVDKRYKDPDWSLMIK
ncbi:DUF4179 domain-containing protein [Paenibacillus dakarensis]|uniref:DUF4179 domain-containing protein n=1 Tax=Paenibacillus dakarensis TaxID=1527293 RepID=UPI0006D553D2|nr:DUF4179 domain-containing protein [Paenibacillus dakarensis]